jgi:hypothetical protein
MKKIATVAELAAITGIEETRIHPARDGKWMISDFGKFSPNLTYIVSGEIFPRYEERNLEWERFRFNNSPIRGWSSTSPLPMEAEAISEFLASMNIILDANETEVLFGDFFKSKKGTSMFEVKPPNSAKHILIAAHWGGPMKNTCGPENVEGSLYHRVARSNGGGAGVTYLVLPKGFRRKVWDDVIDGPKPTNFSSWSTDGDWVSFAKALEEVKKLTTEEKEIIDDPEKASIAKAGIEKLAETLGVVVKPNKRLSIVLNWNHYYMISNDAVKAIEAVSSAKK